LIGQRIRQLRSEHKITQKELSDYLGLTPKMISFYELGQRTPPSDIILKLAAKFNVSTDYLLGNDSPAGYYNDPEVAEIANEMKNNPGMRVLFDASKGLKKKSIEEVRRFIEFQKQQALHDED
jgi:transcriptional regulator with XRE-family HTH domain